MRVWSVVSGIGLVSLLGCSTLSEAGGAPLESEEVTRDKIARVSERLPAGVELFILRAHDHGRTDLISPRVVRYVVRRGEGNAVRNLADFLKNKPDAIIVLADGNDASIAATIVGAIGKLGELEGVVPQGRLYYVGDARYVPELTEKSAAVGLSFTAIVYP